jgi:undecaprenyl-diphosphatase
LNLIEAIILGIIQGLTEFLPISSTGHLTLAGKFMNLISAENPERWTAFIAVIQLGTLAAVLIYFRKDIWNIIKDFLRDNLSNRKSFREQSLNSRMGWFIIIGTIPIVFIGLLFKDFIEGTFTKNLVVISFSLIILGILLAIAEKAGTFKKDLTGIKLIDSIIVGTAQAFALIPGSSRSGTTITAGLFLGFNRETAARFSFLLSIPAVLASGLLEFYKSLGFIDKSGLINMVIATIAAAASGYWAIDFLLKYLRKNSTFIFVFYRIIVGIIILVLIALNVITP